MRRVEPASLAAWSWLRGIATSAAVAGVVPVYSAPMTPIARTQPTTCAPMKAGAEGGAMPAKVAENIRPMVIAWFAKLVEEVKK